MIILDWTRDVVGEQAIFNSVNILSAISRAQSHHVVNTSHYHVQHVCRYPLDSTCELYESFRILITIREWDVIATQSDQTAARVVL